MVGCKPEVGGSNMSREINQENKTEYSYSQNRLLEVEEKLSVYLNEKYDMEFTVSGGGLKSVLEHNDFLIFYPSDNPEDYFRADIMEDGEMNDEYYSLLKQDETAAYIRGMLIPVFGDCYVSARMYRSFGKEYAKGTPVEEAVRLLQSEGEPLMLTANIFFQSTGHSEEELQAMAEEAKGIMEANGLDGLFGIYSMNAELSHEMSWEELEKLKGEAGNRAWKGSFAIHKSES